MEIELGNFFTDCHVVVRFTEVRSLIEDNQDKEAEIKGLREKVRNLETLNQELQFQLAESQNQFRSLLRQNRPVNESPGKSK